MSNYLLILEVIVLNPPVKNLLLIKNEYTTTTLCNSSACQKVVTVTDSPLVATQRLEAVVVDDYGISTAQTIYFIGLIVLLCGIGIIYANSKPVENQQ